ncbi:hypothetical protein KUTeg_011256, partial [Tegillarca granosa]
MNCRQTILTKVKNCHSTQKDTPKHELNYAIMCSCDNCLTMPTAKECLCCHSVSEVRKETNDGNVKCIIHHEGFIANCLNRHVLKASFYEYIEYNGRPDEPVHEQDIQTHSISSVCQMDMGFFGKKKQKNLATMCSKCNKKLVSISAILWFPIPSMKMKISNYYYEFE